jgi:ATP/maltotriose-dependent transcriptional regulator MalT
MSIAVTTVKNHLHSILEKLRPVIGVDPRQLKA